MYQPHHVILCCCSRTCHALRLPFEARSLNELKNKIILGSFAPLKPGQPYSAGLVAVVHALLNKDPRRRPTCAAILNSSEAAPWLHAIPDAVRCPLPPLDAVPSELLSQLLV
jgi:serine/threonine protein kinase